MKSEEREAQRKREEREAEAQLRREEAQQRKEEQEREAQMKREKLEAQLRREEHEREVRLRQRKIEANQEGELKRAELGLAPLLGFRPPPVYLTHNPPHHVPTLHPPRPPTTHYTHPPPTSPTLHLFTTTSPRKDFDPSQHIRPPSGHLFSHLVNDPLGERARVIDILSLTIFKFICDIYHMLVSHYNKKYPLLATMSLKRKREEEEQHQVEGEASTTKKVFGYELKQLVCRIEREREEFARKDSERWAIKTTYKNKINRLRREGKREEMAREVYDMAAKLLVLNDTVKKLHNKVLETRKLLKDEVKAIGPMITDMRVKRQKKEVEAMSEAKAKDLEDAKSEELNQEFLLQLMSTLSFTK
ncbi:cyclin-dependent kinase 11B-like [Procambarus clarkii]|uniref:cyclin-dependent kinase 11B-like n=1 Tax=Procambarus clarkii TaxID=6728 RepID=UPI003744A96A